MKRIGWIDFLRGFSMILILVFHTEVYYKGEEIATPYYVYTTNAIILFYFISGFLLYKDTAFQIKRKLQAIGRYLLLPYFVFTSLLAVPKLLIRNSEINFSEIASNIILGNASWFIAALIIAEVLFSLLLWISRGKERWLSTVALLCFISYYLLPFNQHSYWQWQDALLAFDFLYLGYLYNKHKAVFNTINKPYISLLLLSILILIKVYEYQVDLPMRNIAIENAPLFLADAITWLLLIVSLIPFIPNNKLIEWTGRHSITYYFLCGGCPLIVAMTMNIIGFAYEGYFYRFILAFILVYILASLLTWLINRYVPL